MHLLHFGDMPDLVSCAFQQSLYFPFLIHRIFLFTCNIWVGLINIGAQVVKGLTEKIVDDSLASNKTFSITEFHVYILVLRLLSYVSSTTRRSSRTWINAYGYNIVTDCVNSWYTILFCHVLCSKINNCLVNPSKH